MEYFSIAAFISITNLILLCLALSALWYVSTRIKDASIIDIAWGPACALPAVLTLLRYDGNTARALLLTTLVCVWAARLGLYLANRNLGHGEDIRYQKMREAQGSDEAFAKWSLPRVYLLQGAIAWFVSLPVQFGQYGGGELGFLAGLGTGLFALGLFFEAMGDWQLKEFKKDPDNKGKLMTSGLWAWTRHPNYFGDACVWSGLTLIALETPLGWLTILSPVVMTIFLVFISGKALTEKIMSAKYPEYDAYKTRTSGFIPLPPKSAAEH